jgi:hypothetical protein
MILSKQEVEYLSVGVEPQEDYLSSCKLYGGSRQDRSTRTGLKE